MISVGSGGIVGVGRSNDLRRCTSLSDVTGNCYGSVCISSRNHYCINGFNFSLVGNNSVSATYLVVVSVSDALGIITSRLCFPGNAIEAPSGHALVVGRSFNGEISTFTVRSSNALNRHGS